MPNTIQEIYQQTILPLPESERLKLVALIINDISRQAENGAQAKRGGGLREMFGTWRSGHPHSADNEQIDLDLARAYADNHEDEK
ncbi:MAG: hypothetical protein WKF30_12630 [Pyrinomonadaceae bacterium]